MSDFTYNHISPPVFAGDEDAYMAQVETFLVGIDPPSLDLPARKELNTWGISLHGEFQSWFRADRPDKANSVNRLLLTKLFGVHVDA